jgi:hypothetical protein
MYEFTMEAAKEEVDMVTWVCKEWARLSLGGKKVAEGGVEERDRYIVRPGNLNDCLQVYQDIDYFIGADSKELCDARRREGVLEKSDGRDDVEEMRKILGACQCLRIEPVEPRAHFEGQGKTIHGRLRGSGFGGQSHDEFEHSRSEDERSTNMLDELESVVRRRPFPVFGDVCLDNRVPSYFILEQDIKEGGNIVVGAMVNKVVQTNPGNVEA